MRAVGRRIRFIWSLAGGSDEYVADHFGFERNVPGWCAAGIEACCCVGFVSLMRGSFGGFAGLDSFEAGNVFAVACWAVYGSRFGFGGHEFEKCALADVADCVTKA